MRRVKDNSIDSSVEALAERPDDEALDVPVECVRLNPNNARTVFNQDKVDGIAETIRTHGLLQPLLVREIKDGDSGSRAFEVIAGDTRLLAARKAGSKTVPVRVRNVDDETALLLNLIENMHREDLNAVDEGLGILALRAAKQSQLNAVISSVLPNTKKLLDPKQIEIIQSQAQNIKPWMQPLLEHAKKIGRHPKVTWKVIGQELGITPRHVYNLISIAQLPNDLQKQIRQGHIQGRQARSLAVLKNSPEKQKQLLAEILANDLRGDQAMERAQQLRKPSVTPSATQRQYGSHINFRGLLHEPINEQGVVFLFGMVAKELGYTVESVQVGFPDCEAKRPSRTRKDKLEKVFVEFEFQSKNFLLHGHDASQCHLIVCWEHNWPDCPIEVLELKSEIKKLPSSVS